MKVPHAWLRELCDPGLPAAELGEQLTMTGTKVEAIHHHGVRSLEHFVVGHVLQAVQHPDADRLRVCTVDLAAGDPVEIVCGAPNVAAGQTVAVARPGAVMPDGTKLKRAKLRGVVSNGMICAEDELGIGTDHDGIMVLGDGAAPGTPLADVLPLATDVIEFEVTPNRPDCLGIFGIAREVHATTGAPLAEAPWAHDAGTEGPVEGVEVRVEAPDLNPRFTARAFDGVRIAPSPAWLKARLMAAGVRPINNVVDITNYVMLLVGHPLHAFDLDRVAGGVLVVRRARDGEVVRTLDGQDRTLDSGMLVIDDAEGPTSIAGIMGGERSEVHEGTTSVLLEVASWDGHMIQTASNRLALRSEASGRFEKGLAPEQAMEAQAVATGLMLELTGATLRPGTVDVRAPGVPAPPATVRFRPAQTARLLGRDVPAERQVEILESLEFAVDGETVTVPHFRRNDVTREADLVEEVARIDGLANLPATLPKRRDTAGRLPLPAKLRRRAVDALVGRGLLEVAGWSFTHPSLTDRLRLAADDPRRGLVALENPMSEDQSVLRPTLLGSLLDVAARNVARGTPDLALFEQGAVYRLPLDPLPVEHRALGAVLLGRALTPPTWRAPRPPAADVFAAKALLEAVFAALRVPLATVSTDVHPFLHPGRSARVLAGAEEVGWLGEVHPLVARAWDLDGPVAAFEVDLDALVDRADAEPQFAPLSEFPALRLDLAVVVPDDVTAAAVLRAVHDAGGRLLADARVFDVFRGEQLGAGRVSLALALAFRAPDRTLTDEDVAPVRDAILDALRTLGGELRG